MCGLLYGLRKDKRPVGKNLVKRFNQQRSRGHDGFGYITIRDGKVENIKRFTRESDFEKELGKEKSNEIFVHHRYPTSSPNELEQTHPMVVDNEILDRRYYVMHNGVLRDYEQPKAEHDALGFQYTTEVVKKEQTIQKSTGALLTEVSEEYYNDSEVLAVEIALMLEGWKDTLDVKGTIAFVCLETDKNDKVLKVHYGRNAGNPLFLENNRDLRFLRSSAKGNGVKEIDDDQLVTIDYKTGTTTWTKMDIGETYMKSGLGFQTNKQTEINEPPSNPTQRVLADRWSREDPTPYYANPYSGLESESPLTSQERYDDLFKEKEDLEQDIDQFQTLSDRALENQDTLQYAEYEEAIEDARVRVKTIEHDLSWIEDVWDSVGRAGW